jgi:hypothetical protein
MDHIDVILERIKKIKESQPNILFRGQPRYSYNLISSLSRGFKEEYKDAQGEMEKCEVIIKLIQEEKNYYKQFLKKYEHDLKLLYETNNLKSKLQLIKPFDTDNEKNILGLMQHYGIPTRCLDLTYNLFTALFFSLPEDLNQKEDAALWVIDRDKLLTRYINKDLSGYKSFNKKLNLITATKYQSVLSDVEKLYEERIAALSKNKKHYEENCMELQDETLNQLLGAVRMDIEEKDLLGRERHSTLEENLYCGGLNEHLCRQDGLFIIQGFKPIPINDEFSDGRDTSGADPFIKIIIPSNQFQSIRNFLETVGITEKSIYN